MKFYTALFTTLISLTGTHAHHDISDDFATSLSQIGGVITGLEWSDPHVLVRLSIHPDSASSQHYLIEMGPPEELEEEGITIDTFELMSRVSIVAYSSKSKVSEHGYYLYGLYLVESQSHKLLVNKALYEILPQVDFPSFKVDP